MAKRREDRTAAIRARLAGDKEKLAKFEQLLGYSKYAYSLTEDHAFYTHQMVAALFRRYLSSIGRAPAQACGCPQWGDDIFFLYDGEVRDAMANDTDLRALIEKRKVHYTECSKVTPVASLGPPPQAPKSGEFVDPFVDALASPRLLGVKPHVVRG